MTPERERLVRAVKVAERHLDDMIAAEDGDAESNAWVCLDIAERALAAYDAAHKGEAK